MPVPQTNSASHVDLLISCSELCGTRLSVTAPPSPVVYLEAVTESDNPEVIARTDQLSHTASPVFTTPITVPYSFEVVQRYRFVVVDNPASSVASDINYERKNVIGIATVTMAQIMSASGGTFTEYLQLKSKPTGVIKIKVVSQDNSLNLRLRLSGSGLDKKDLFGKSDPYFIVYRIEDNGEKRKVYESEIIRNTLYPEWQPVNFQLGQLVSILDQDFMNRSILIECFDWDRDSDHDLIGSATIKLSALTPGASIPLINFKKLKHSNYYNSGHLVVRDSEVVRNYSFHEYLAGGTEVSIGVAIDFSAHNQLPGSGISLHEIDPSGSWNDYMRALDAVLSVLEPYNSDRTLPVYGFGGVLPGFRKDHFHVNCDPQSPYVQGRAGALAAYSNCVGRVTPVLDTHLAPLISRFSYTLEQSDNPRLFMILLILTKGCISDYDATVEALVHASQSPLSVIIVGIGNDDLTLLRHLDSDESILSTKGGKKAVRDIVQFVPFNKYSGSHRGDALARDVLREVPKQLTSYMESKGITPIEPTIDV